MFNPFKLITFIWQAGFEGQKVVKPLQTIKSCADLYFKIRKL